jgi:four helix bundle protein
MISSHFQITKLAHFQIMRNDKENVIVTKAVNFSIAVIQFTEVLEQERKYVIAKQLLLSGTSIGANIFEAQNTESRADFIHKMKIAAKEASETLYWLLLCERSETYPFNQALPNDLAEIIRILSRIIATSKR